MATWSDTVDPSHWLRVFSGHPFPIHWQGWHTTSSELQARGWVFHASEYCDNYNHGRAIRVAFRSPDSVMMISGELWYRPSDLYAAADFYNSSSMFPSDFFSNLAHRGFECKAYQAKDQILTVSHADFASFEMLREVDPAGMDVNLRQLGGRFEDFKIFKYKEQQTKEIFIPSQSVDECLDRILQLQYPVQKEIKKGLVLPEKQPIIQAKVFSLAS